MRQIVKRVKDGQEIRFICSICEEIIYCVFMLNGNRCEIDWGEIPEKCSCGAKLKDIQPIIDGCFVGKDGYFTGKDGCFIGMSEGYIGTDNMSRNVHGNIHGNSVVNVSNVNRNACRFVPGGIHENSDIYNRYIMDFGTAVSIDYFDMRLNGLKERGFKVPDNIDNLRTECIARNISYVESCMGRCSYSESGHDRSGLRERMKILRQMHSEMSEKCEYGKDFDKKRF